MVETAEVGKRVRRTIEQSKRIAQERRGRAAAVEREGGSVLASVVTPVFKTVAATLKSEGYQFQVFSPVGPCGWQRMLPARTSSSWRSTRCATRRL